MWERWRDGVHMEREGGKREKERGKETLERGKKIEIEGWIHFQV